mgnify:CR=1 FL=1
MRYNFTLKNKENSFTDILVYTTDTYAEAEKCAVEYINNENVIKMYGKLAIVASSPTFDTPKTTSQMVYDLPTIQKDYWEGEVAEKVVRYVNENGVGISLPEFGKYILDDNRVSLELKVEAYDGDEDLNRLFVVVFDGQRIGHFYDYCSGYWWVFITNLEKNRELANYMLSKYVPPCAAKPVVKGLDEHIPGLYDFLVDNGISL